MIKKLSVLIVLIAFALSIAGCTSPLNTGSPSTSQATAQHDAFLEKYLSNFQQVQQENYTVKAWDVTWKNSTTADIEASLQNKTTNSTIGGPIELILFPSTDAATAYLNSQKAGYSLYSTKYPAGGAYARTAGHAPAVYKDYTKHTGDSLLNVTTYELTQTDNIVSSGTLRYL